MKRRTRGVDYAQQASPRLAGSDGMGLGCRFMLGKLRQETHKLKFVWAMECIQGHLGI